MPRLDPWFADSAGKRSAGRTLAIGFIVMGMISTQPRAHAQDEGGREDLRPGYLISVPLPVTESVATSVKQQLQRIADEAPKVVDANKRPVLFLEFDMSGARSGQGSELGSCLTLAMFLTDARMRHLQTVAFVPAPRGFNPMEQDPDLPVNELAGHAVLIALACNELAMVEDSAIGSAGIDDETDPALATQIYENIAAKRLALPIPIARALVDKSQSLYRIETSDGLLFVNQAELESLEQAGKVINSETLSQAASFPSLTSQALLNYRLIRHRVDSRRDLAFRFNVDPTTIEGDPSAGGQWTAVQLRLTGYLDERASRWAVRMLNQHLVDNPTNLIIVRLETDDGEMQACLNLARTLADLDSNQQRTVAFIEDYARGPCAVVAMACDQLIMTPTAVLGGPGVDELSDEAIEDAEGAIKDLAEKKDRSWSLTFGLVDSNVSVQRYRNRRTGQQQIFSREELDEMADSAQWGVLGEVDLSEGLQGTVADQLMLTRTLVDDFEQLKAFYQLEQSPPELQPSLADRWIETLARELAQPWFAGFLLFGAVFLLSTEMSNPGIGVPGFLGTICLLLFFWSQYLDGNAHWLEILLFVVGLGFILLEVFVLPGFGIFGIGGLLMTVTAIVLATQTFVWPRNSEEMAQLPVSMAMIIASGCGFFAALFMIRRYLPHMPVLKRIMLDPTDDDESPTEKAKRELLVDLSHLDGRTGTAVTQLMPSGKARIGNQIIDVISDGRLIEKNARIQVAEVLGNRVVVRPVEDSST